MDDQSLAYLQKATVKYVEENGRAGFTIEVDSPQAAAAGCAGCDPSTGCG